MKTLTAEWNRLAGFYIHAADAVRAADHDPKVSVAAYRSLVAAREIAFAAIDAYQQAQCQADTVLSESAESRVERGLFPAPGPHCVECGSRLTAIEAAAQSPNCDEVCDACGGPGSEHKRLLAELTALPAYQGWTFTYEYPGLFCYHHPDDTAVSVFFTPDWSTDGELSIEVQDTEGSCIENTVILLPHEGRTGQQLVDLVSPYLDKYQPTAPTQEQPEAYHDGCDC